MRRVFDPRFLILGGMVLLIAAISWAYYSSNETPKESVSSGTKSDVQTVVAPAGNLHVDFSLPDLNGGTINMVDLRGKYVLVNFWASWCPPCLREMPTLDAYYLAHHDQNFEMVAINYAEDMATVSDFVAANDFHFPIALDVTGVIFDRQYLGDALPTSFLIGPDGKLIKTWPAGVLTTAIMDRDITPLLEN